MTEGDEESLRWFRVRANPGEGIPFQGMHAFTPEFKIHLCPADDNRHINTLSRAYLGYLNQLEGFLRFARSLLFAFTTERGSVFRFTL